MAKIIKRIIKKPEHTKVKSPIIKTLDDYTKAIEMANYHCHCYYIKNDPVIPDEVYDSLYHEIKRYEEAHPLNVLGYSPTQRIGSPLDGTLTKITRKIEMASMDNAFTDDDISKFVERLYETDIAAEFKLDGAGLELIYMDGILTQAISRGTGFEGEDVTHAARAIKTIPTKFNKTHDLVPQRIEIRGEVIMPYASVEAYRKNHKDKKIVSPRNLAAGGIRLLDPKKVAERGLIFIPHSVGEVSPDFPLENIKQFNTLCKEWGFRILTTQIISCKLADMKKLYTSFLKYRPKLPFAADGVVFKVNDFKRQQYYGSTNKAPKWAIAWKFPAEEKTTKLRDVIFQVGRTGVITPVAVFDPIVLSDAEVTRATLHNFDEISRKDIHYGDTLIVSRSGDVIPKVHGVVLEDRDKGAEQIRPPKFCPECMSDTDFVAHGTLLVCTNAGCPAKLEGRFNHFVSRNAMNITGLGESIIKQLIAEGYFTCLLDIYKTDYRYIGKATGKEKTFNKIAEAVEASKKTTQAKFLFALGIPLIGEVQAQTITDKYSLRDIFYQTEFDARVLQNLDNIGEAIARSLDSYLCNGSLVDETQKLIDLMQFEGLSVVSNALEDKVFCITGTLSKGRKEFEAIIKANGGKLSGSVGSKTTHLLVGENPGNDKIINAAKYETEMIDEAFFNTMLASKS